MSQACYFYMFQCVFTGFIDTDMTRGVIKRQELEKTIPLGRFGLASEVADAALFLAKSNYITGHVSTNNNAFSQKP